MENAETVTIYSLATLWAQKYVDKLRAQAAGGGPLGLQLADKVKGSLRFASSQAWAKTEKLLAAEIPRQGLDPDLKLQRTLKVSLSRQPTLFGEDRAPLRSTAGSLQRSGSASARLLEHAVPLHRTNAAAGPVA
jgi:hypothetical protein